MADVVAERVLPHNLDAERSVLGAILVDASAWLKAAAVVRPASFYRDAHRRIFEAMQRLYDAGSQMDGVLLKNELARVGDLDECGGPAYLASLTDGVPRSTNVEYYARVVQEKAALRDAITAANKVLTDAYAEEPSSVVLEDGVRRLLALANPTDGGVVTIGAAMQDWLAHFEHAEARGIGTGLVDLDEILAGGFHDQQLVMIAGRPSMGKTTLLMNIAEYVAHRASPVAIFTLEMDPRALIEQSIARNATVDANRLRTKTLSQKDYGRLSHAMELLHDMKLYFVEHVTTLTQIQAWCRRLSEEHGVKVFGLDYIQRMGDLQTRDRRLEIDYISRGLQRIAKDLNAVFIVLSQLTRDPEKRSDKRPQLSDLKESGGLEADADVVLLLYRADVYDKDPHSAEAGIAEIIVAKNRMGPVGVARTAFLREQLRFVDLARGA